MSRSHGCRSRLATLAIGLWLAALPACEPALPTPERAVIRFALHEDDAAHYQPIAQEFEQTHPDITVEILSRDYDTLASIGPADADVLLVGDAGRRQAQGELLNLEPWLAGDESFERTDYYPGSLELFRREGKAWAIPAALDPIVMYYNKDLFDLRRVPYPQPGWSWYDFLGTAQALTDSESKVYGFVFTPGGTDCYWFIYQHGGRLLDDLQDPTRTTFEEPLTIDALDWCADLIQVHHVAPTDDEAVEVFGGRRQYAAYMGVRAGKVGLWTLPFSERGGEGWPEPWQFRYGLTDLPRDARAATWVNVQALAISSQTRFPNPCWQFVSYLSREMPRRLMPARRSLAESEAYERLVGTEAARVTRAAVEDSLMVDLSGEVARYGAAFEALNQAIAKVLNGEAKAREALGEAQRQAEEANAGP